MSDNNNMNYMKIGNVKLKHNTVLAPLAAVNNAAFRLLCKDKGAGLINTAMIHVNSLAEQPEKILELTNIQKKERPLSVQLVGCDSERAKIATQKIEEHADIIDVNLGCPDKQILSQKSGGFFSKHPEQIKKILKPIMDNTNKPVTAKIRIGWDEINTLDSIKILNDFGVNAITIHGRLVKQMYTGKANLEEIKKAKEKSNIPIIGNGDIRSGEDALNMINKTKCDAVMIGRATMGDPDIFRRINNFIEKNEKNEYPTWKEKKQDCLKFIEYYDKIERNRSFSELRQHIMWFTKGLKGSKKFRNSLLQSKSLEELQKEISNFD